jgi:uncharacterized protein YndB with AHSA1/START domain
VNPETITKFWLDSTSGALAPGAKVEWAFMVPNATESVQVTEFKENERIAFQWSDGVSVALSFSDVEGGTRLAVKVAGFKKASEAVNAAEGFSIVLCDLKTLLESGTSANLVRDKAVLIAIS